MVREIIEKEKGVSNKESEMRWWWFKWWWEKGNILD